MTDHRDIVLLDVAGVTVDRVTVPAYLADDIVRLLTRAQANHLLWIDYRDHRCDGCHPARKVTS